MNQLVTVVSPVYNAESIVPLLVSQVSSALNLQPYNFEIILVDDGSSDQSWKTISLLSKDNVKVKGIKLSRNFGQHYAVTAGLEYAQGDIIIIMDCDLQDDPIYISELLKKYEQGFDIVFTKRVKRKHGLVKTFLANMYNLCFYLFADKSYDVNVGSLTLLTKRVKVEFLRLNDKDRLYIQILRWVGFMSTNISVEHRDRISGNSTYTFSKLISLAVQGWTSHSVKLLRFSIYFGFALSSFAFLAGVAIIIMKVLYGFQAGWSSIIVTILFSTGVLQLSIGILGIYLGKIFEQTKNRPLYVIEEKLNV